jgi:diguanylate cyclase (GGDEF)-like protein
LLILLDVLELRTINDRHGYAFGDEVLKAIADALLEATRTTDLVARYGGDEFAVLLVDVEPKDVSSVVDRVVAQVEQGKRRRDLPDRVAVSLGVAFSTTPAATPDDLFRTADADMLRRRLSL